MKRQEIMRNRCLSGILFLLFACAPFAPSQAEAPPRPGEEKLLEEVDGVMKDVERLRGMPFLQPVEKGICTAAEFKDFVLAEMKKELPEKKLRAMEAAYTALGLLPPGTDLKAEAVKLLAGQVAGYYNPETKSFKLVRGRAKGAAALIAVAHELTHALDDQYYDLEAHSDAAKGCADEEFAFGAVAEGSATILQMRYMLEGQARGRFDMKSMMEQAKAEKTQAKRMESAPPTLVADLLGRYMMGMYFLSRGNLAGARRGCGKSVEAAMFDPPLSSEQILHPEKYWDPERRDDPVRISFPRAEEVMGKGWRCLEMDTLGEIQCALLARPKRFKLRIGMNAAMGNPRFWTNKAAAGWGGDRFALYRNEKGKTALFWVAAWDTGKDAAQFLEAFKRYRGDLPSAVLAAGKVTVFAFGLEKEKALTLLEALLPKLRFRKAGSWDPGYPAR